MLKVFATVLCFYLACNLIVNGAAIDKDSSSESSELVNNATAIREKRGAYWPYDHGHHYEHHGHHGHHGYPFHYYHWYDLHPTSFIAGHCPAQYQCPPECPGTCGTWGDLYACRCHHGCPLIGDPCNHHNIHHGHFLHAFPHDATKYVQCDTTPGVVYIRSCPAHLVFDPRFSVCNYPNSVYHHHHHGHHAHHHGSYEKHDWGKK